MIDSANIPENAAFAQSPGSLGPESVARLHRLVLWGLVRGPQVAAQAVVSTSKSFAANMLQLQHG
ncbi:MAG: hypothetical protein ACI86S_000649 [Paracoccaceae bacterium]|jgi:hypothetical protein